MVELFEPMFLNKLQHLVFASKGTSFSSYAGRRKSRIKGSSVEFSDYRPYVFGDDLRRLDWNAYGRLNIKMLKLYTEEREACVNIFLDTSQSMDFGNPNKSVVSRRLALAVAYIALTGYDSVSLYAVQNSIEHQSKGFRGKNAIFQVMQDLKMLQYQGQMQLYDSLRKAQLGLGQMTFIISDFLGVEDLAQSLAFLRYQKHRIFLLQVLDTEEVAPKLSGNLRLTEGESEAYCEVSFSRNVYLKYQKAYADFIKTIEDTAYRHQAHWLQVIAPQDLDAAIRKVVALR